jgi:Fic family protein
MIIMSDSTEQKIIDFLKENEGVSSKEIHEAMSSSISYSTIKRVLTKLNTQNFVITKGQKKATKYYVSKAYEILSSIDLEKYYQSEIDERKVKAQFSFDLIRETLNEISLFSKEELNQLNALQSQFNKNIQELSESSFKKEFERLAIDLSWKSSQIEGNTYSLLETEILLKEKQTASGKTKDEATMLLNHKDALDFILENPDYLIPLSLSKIEDIHRILIKELGVDKNLRKRRVGISGTNYTPLDNEFQIKEAVISMCDLINSKENIFEKALLAVLLVSYIQPFMDGNKRTARILSNAILINYKYCPISFRTVDSIEYKKAMLLFYEQNNVSRFKEIFITQYKFAVENYF